MDGKFYFEPRNLSGFSNLKRLHAAARGRTVGELREWLEAQDASARAEEISAQSLHREYYGSLGMRFS
jgi:hypothetical protein